MNSGCESHYRAGGRDRHAVESNCVAARRGGEQLETEGWSRTKVNSIRHVRRASLLGQGEACRASGEQITVRELPRLESCRLGCGWSGNDWKGTWDKWRARLGSRREGPDAVRAFIVAGKPDNSGGAKGRRKMKTLATVRDQTSSIAVRLERWSASRAVRAGPERLEAILGTGCLREQGHVGPTFFLRPWFNMRSTSPSLDLINWRAGCGKTACPIRREGRRSNAPFLPLLSNCCTISARRRTKRINGFPERGVDNPRNE